MSQNIEPRPRSPTAEEVAHVQGLLDRFRSANCPLETVDPRDFLRQLFQEPVWCDEQNLDRFSDVLYSEFHQKHPLFPTFWWHDDPSCGIDEMKALLADIGIKRRFRGKEIQREALAALYEGDEREEVVFVRTSEKLVSNANCLLEMNRNPRRFERFSSEDEYASPCWVLVTTAEREALLREGLFTIFAGLPPLDPLPVYVRPTDRGEIDFDNFPSGGDPF